MLLSVLGRLATVVVALTITMSLLTVLAPHTSNISLLLQSKPVQENAFFRRLHMGLKVRMEVRSAYQEKIIAAMIILCIKEWDKLNWSKQITFMQ